MAPNCLAIARAEPLDAVDVEQGLRRGHQHERFGLIGRALVGRVEAADAVDLVAEEIEAESQVVARREDVDERAADRIFAMLRDRVGALIAERIELADEGFARDPLALGDAAGELPHPEGRQHPLRGCTCRCDEQLRLVRLGLERAQRCQPLRHHAQRGGGAVVRQAVPSGQGQHLDFGREQGDRFSQGAHRRFVGDDGDGAGRFAAAVGSAGKVGGEPRQEAGRHAGQRQRLGGAQHALERLAHRSIRM